MIDKEFLNEWLGRTFHISVTDPPSTRTLEKKVSDKHVQVSAAEYHQRPGVSTVFAGFICRNVDDPKDVAFVRVFVQYLDIGEGIPCAIVITANQCPMAGATHI
jgi:hypothetical protein